jgi:flagellar hook-associated protein 1 FlgK
LMRFQQAYQASSRIISIANTIFDTLLQVAR